MKRLKLKVNQTDTSHETLKKTLKLHKFHLYKMQILQEPNDDNFDRRIELYEIMSNLINATHTAKYLL